MAPEDHRSAPSSDTMAPTSGRTLARISDQVQAHVTSDLVDPTVLSVVPGATTSVAHRSAVQDPTSDQAGHKDPIHGDSTTVDKTVITPSAGRAEDQVPVSPTMILAQDHQEAPGISRTATVSAEIKEDRTIGRTGMTGMCP